MQSANAGTKTVMDYIQCGEECTQPCKSDLFVPTAVQAGMKCVDERSSINNQSVWLQGQKYKSHSIYTISKQKQDFARFGHLTAMVTSARTTRVLAQH